MDILGILFWSNTVELSPLGSAMGTTPVEFSIFLEKTALWSIGEVAKVMWLSETTFVKCDGR